RFLRAKELLDTTELTVAEIAYRLRFETPSHFSTFFRKREGVPPQQYRRERRQPGR
ncbi:MAG: helix-turn-helix domain-containing protein, partial [Alistipes sp.]|nr:helix-turn-helix domain-containing protein [Alistipes sp.]